MRGWGRPTKGSGQMRVWLGRGPITYPTRQPFCSGKLVETGTSFYIGTNRLVKLPCVHRRFFKKELFLESFSESSPKKVKKLMALDFALHPLPSIFGSIKIIN
jgi:hypothetical protein